MKKELILAFALLFPLVLTGQTYSEKGEVYPLSNDGTGLVISGFKNLKLSDETLIANAYLWTLENVCPQLKEGITETSFPERKFAFDVRWEHLAADGKPHAYTAHVTLRAKDGKLVYLISDIYHTNAIGGVLNRVTPLHKYAAKDTQANRVVLSGAEEAASSMLNQLFDYVVTHKLKPIRHWNDINISRPVNGMNTDECLLAFGKPLVVSGTDEVQWMYNNSFFLFFRGGVVTTILK